MAFVYVSRFFCLLGVRERRAAVSMMLRKKRIHVILQGMFIVSLVNYSLSLSLLRIHKNDERVGLNRTTVWVILRRRETYFSKVYAPCVLVYYIRFFSLAPHTSNLLRTSRSDVYFSPLPTGAVFGVLERRGNILKFFFSHCCFSLFIPDISSLLRTSRNGVCFSPLRMECL